MPADPARPTDLDFFPDAGTGRLELLDAIAVPAVLVRAEDRSIVYANLAYVGLVRAAGPHEVVGKPISRFIPPDDHDRVQEDLRNVRRGDPGVPDNRFGVLRLDGTIGTVEAYPIPFVHKGERMMLSVLIDVTDRVQAENALAEAEARYRLLFELAPVGICVQADGRYAFANPELCRMLGAASAKDLIGKPIADTIVPEDRERIAQSIANTMAGLPGSTRLVVPMVGLDGRRLVAEVTARRIDFEGGPATQAILRELGPEESASERRTTP